MAAAAQRLGKCLQVRPSQKQPTTLPRVVQLPWSKMSPLLFAWRME